MAGITALGTSYNLPNYTGVLYMLTPTDTPFFSAIGGLSGGGQVTDWQIEWETEDLRSAGQNVALEGQAAPAAQERVRAQVTNVCQIHQETVGVSYTKQAAIGRKAGLANDEPNPITNELDHQTELMLKQMARDVEYSFINGRFQLPVDNTTTRQTRGLLQAITTNALNAAVAINGGVNAVAAALTDTITTAGGVAHGLTTGDQLVFTAVQAPLVTAPTVWSPAAPTAGIYWAIVTGAATLQVATSAANAAAGTAVDLTANGNVTMLRRPALTKALIDTLCQQVYDNGGIMEGETATIMVPSAQKRALTTAYTAAGYVTKELAGNLGGVTVSRLETDFGTLNVMLDRHMPPDKLAVVSMEQCAPVYLEIPGKGHFFQEPLAKTGAFEQNQLYGEVGLKYGNEAAHGSYINLAV